MLHVRSPRLKVFPYRGRDDAAKAQFELFAASPAPLRVRLKALHVHSQLVLALFAQDVVDDGFDALPARLRDVCKLRPSVEDARNERQLRRFALTTTPRNVHLESSQRLVRQRLGVRLRRALCERSPVSRYE